jgi:UDP-glucose 4-epimerase
LTQIAPNAISLQLVTGNPSSTYLVTGGAGFIGSHLVDSLLADAATTEVRVLDNFSSGRREHLIQHEKNPKLKIHAFELLDFDKIAPCFQGVDQVFHLAANPDARWGIDNTRLDLEQETIVTYNVLEAMRRSRVPRIVFSSSGTVYGDVGTTVTNENFGPCLPVSLYGAGKVASEGLISAFCGTFGMRAIIFRFGNIVGERTTHGVIYDFLRQLAKNPADLKVLGNGYQAKPYGYVRDLVDGLMFGKACCSRLEPSRSDVFNLAPDGATSVRFIAAELIRQLGFAERTQLHYGESTQGWPGDVPQSRMDSSKLKKAGFSLARTSDEAVRLAIQRILGWLSNSKGELRLPPGASPVLVATKRN